MEVLPPPPQFSTSVPPALFTECINTGQFKATRSVSTTSPLPSTPASPSASEHPVRFARTPSPARLAIGDFVPLPTIAASPVCTPISSFRSSAEPIFEITSTHDNNLTLHGNADRPKDTTPPNSSMSLRILFATPTWISTPPTPPHKQIRQPTSCDPRKPSTPVLPSASFPASTPPHATPASPQSRLKRCLSFPAMPSRSRTISEPALTFGPSQLSEVLDDQSPLLPKRPKTIFHISNDFDEFSGGEDAPSLMDLSPTGSFDGHGSIGDMQTQNFKDAVRIFHALQELLTTEMDYTRDLRILLVAYIRRLPSFEVRTSAFARASATLATGPWINAYAGQTLTPTDVIIPSSSSASMKPIFSETEIGLLARNLKDILQMHEEFISTLRALLTPLGFSNTASNIEPPKNELEDFSTLTSVLKSVSQTFAAEAFRFEIYQSFCAGHPEAVSLIRRVILQYPSDWESFEQRCWAMIFRLSERGDHSSISATSQQPNLLGVPVDDMTEQSRHRTMSTTSPGSRPSRRLAKEVDRVPDRRQSRLAFMDYLIKPVQRICKYTLLLEQLKPRASFPGSDDITFTIENAIQIMRSVTASVDEARRKREAVTKSSLIISRFILPPLSPSLTPGPPTASQQSLHTLTASFLSSLGPCLLAGSLDVMYYSPRRSFGNLPSITAKYLGAFLYSGGYLILAKIHKGKKYEPRHWFSLAEFEITGVEGDEAMLPCSFRLSSKAIHFELAAACQREKNIWVQGFRDSAKQQPTWVNIPLPSYKAVGRAHRSSDPRTDGFRPITPGGSDTELSAPAFRMELRRRKLTLRKSDAAILQDQIRLPNRRSSTASIRSIFAPMGHDPNSIYINRSMIGGRLQVDHDLQDVASQVCLSARLYASLHDEELFPQPPQQHRERSGFSRSNSAISVAGLARNRLSKQESLRVPRRKPPYDSMIQPQTEQILPLSARRNRKTLSLQSLPLRPLDVSFTEPGRPLSASTTTVSNTRSSSNMSTAIFTPLSAGSSPLSRPVSPLSFGRRSSRLSLVRNVKELFQRGVSQGGSHSPDQSHPDGLNLEHSSPLLKRWKRGTLRRRSRSVPPDDSEDLSVSK